MAKKAIDPIEDRWIKKAQSVLLNRRIVSVRYMLDQELDLTGFQSKCVVIGLDDGTLLYPSMDDEGNDAGAIHYQKEGDQNYILPVI